MFVWHSKDGEGVPIKTWLHEGTLEGKAADQAANLARLPFVHKHVALMPDCHMGYGMPIGGVIATKGVVIPNAVGVDIGCGMGFVDTDIGVEHVDLKAVMEIIRKTVPVGFSRHQVAQDELWMPTQRSDTRIVNREYEKACKQVGTLGGGNHFIELQRDPHGLLCIMIHSGSRNLGKQVADHYNKVAKRANAYWHCGIDPKWDLAFLPIEDEQGDQYMREMKYCVDFAFANRRLMMESVIEAIKEVCRNRIIFSPLLNIAHNYAVMENHFGKNVMVHRKGATRARKGEMGIIPGSQGTPSYIVRGLGNPESFNSCSHGAGRVMGRKEARRTLNLEVEVKRLEDAGVIHSLRTADDLDEAASCYKDIEEVMGNQRDLVEIVTKLEPIAVIKG